MTQEQTSLSDQQTELLDLGFHLADVERILQSKYAADGNGADPQVFRSEDVFIDIDVVFVIMMESTLSIY